MGVTVTIRVVMDNHQIMSISECGSLRARAAYTIFLLTRFHVHLCGSCPLRVDQSEEEGFGAALVFRACQN